MICWWDLRERTEKIARCTVPIYDNGQLTPRSSSIYFSCPDGAVLIWEVATLTLAALTDAGHIILPASS